MGSKSSAGRRGSKPEPRGGENKIGGDPSSSATGGRARPADAEARGTPRTLAKRGSAPGSTEPSGEKRGVDPVSASRSDAGTALGGAAEPTRAGEATAALSESRVETPVPPGPQATGTGALGGRNPGLDRRQLLDLYYYMLLTRRVEERLVNLRRQGKVLGGLYRSLGQEATAVGSAYALESGDLIAPLIRDLGAVLVRGYSPRDCFAQFMGRAVGPTQGRDCVLHMGELGGRGVISSIAMLGNLIPVLAGCGLALRRAGRDRVCLTWIGDGGASTGVFHEGLNFAALHRLPLVLIIENNGHAYSTPVSKQTAEPDFSTRGPQYGIPGTSVDGNDVLAVYAATRAAVADARAGRGPTVIEARTFRMKGHAEHDDASYVPKELLEEWSKKDPIARYERWLYSEAALMPKEIGAIAAGVEAQLDEDLRWVEQSPQPGPESALRGVYSEDSPFQLPSYPLREKK